MLGNIDLKVAGKNFYIFIVDDFINNEKNPFSLSLNFFKEIPENGIMFQLLICFLKQGISVDMEKKEGFVLLTNRIHPTRENTVFLEKRKEINKVWLDARS